MTSTAIVLVQPNCILDGREMRAFRYANDDIRNGQATMWVSDGRVKFHNRRGNITPWHGHFNEESEGGPIVLKFDYEGRPNLANRKTAMLYKVCEREWRGCDYMGRRISLTLLQEMDFCRTCQCWHIRD